MIWGYIEFVFKMHLKESSFGMMEAIMWGQVLIA